MKPKPPECEQVFPVQGWEDVRCSLKPEHIEEHYGKAWRGEHYVKLWWWNELQNPQRLEQER